MSVRKTLVPSAASLSTPARRRGRRAAAVAAVGLAGAGALALAVMVLGPGAAFAATTAGTTNCVAVPSKCGFPDATNTGVPAGTTLLTVPGQISSGPGWHYDSRGWVQVTGNGAVLSGLYIPYNLNIAASNVTIKNDKIVTSGQTSFGISLRSTSNVTIQNSTISGLNATTGRLQVGIKDIYGDSTGLQILSNDIGWTGTGVQAEGGLIQGNYIHDMGYISGDHVDGIHSDGGGTTLMTINDNTILISQTQTGAVVLNEDNGGQANRVVSGNLLAGGGYAIYAGQGNGGAPATGIKVTGNRVSTLYYPKGGVYGPVADYNTGGSGNTWTSNTWDATGTTIPSP